MSVTVSGQRAAASAAEFDAAWLANHLKTERREASMLSEIREAVFGAQDGLTSVLAVVSTVGGATGQPFAVLVAGFAAMLAGVFSMAAGEYMSSKSQREIFEAQIAHEAIEVEERPHEAEAEVAFLLEKDGLERQVAQRVARELAQNKRVHPDVPARVFEEYPDVIVGQPVGSRVERRRANAGEFLNGPHSWEAA